MTIKNIIKQAKLQTYKNLIDTIETQESTMDEIISHLTNCECDATEGTEIRLKECEDYKNIPIFFIFDSANDTDGVEKFYVHEDTFFNYKGQSFNPSLPSHFLENNDLVETIVKSLTIKKSYAVKPITINNLEKIRNEITEEKHFLKNFANTQKNSTIKIKQ